MQTYGQRLVAARNQKSRFQDIQKLAFASGHSCEYHSTDLGCSLGRVDVMPVPPQPVAVCTVTVAKVPMIIGNKKRDVV